MDVYGRSMALVLLDVHVHTQINAFNRKETKEHYQKCHHLTRLLHSQLQVKTFDINIHQQCINQPPPAKPHITASIWTPYVIDAGAEQSKLEHKIGCEFSMVSVYFT